jgi:hypothetical protein
MEITNYIVNKLRFGISPASNEGCTVFTKGARMNGRNMNFLIFYDVNNKNAIAEVRYDDYYWKTLYKKECDVLNEEFAKTFDKFTRVCGHTSEDFNLLFKKMQIDMI